MRNLETGIHRLPSMVLSILTGRHCEDRLTQASLFDPPHQEWWSRKGVSYLMPNSMDPRLIPRMILLSLDFTNFSLHFQVWFIIRFIRSCLCLFELGFYFIYSVFLSDGIPSCIHIHASSELYFKEGKKQTFLHFFLSSLPWLHPIKDICPRLPV